MSKKSKKQQIIEALEAKGFVVTDAEYTPHNNALWGSDGGWVIDIDEEKTPLRHVENPILGRNFEEVMAIVKQAALGIDFCPTCGCGIDHHEERVGKCTNCGATWEPLNQF